MKRIENILVLFLLYNCSKNKHENTRTFLNSKNDFSVSAFEKKLNYVKGNDSLEIPPAIYDKRLNKDYLNGAFHFLILNKDNSYYAIDSTRLFPLMCGNRSEFSKQDSINFIRESTTHIQKLKPIKTAEIIKILKQNQNTIVNADHINPLNISFALKNDILQGSAMYDIINFMENNGMKLYTIRRMNEYEITKTK
ncbi:hypothetical protein [Chryseobacterium sp. JUb7]|uniref:hypothetical protein n=1 Tax=Chryseobacterium sp. JUb7 TaxID=2940599 RepID=UPI0021670166|nr:hypothetical protein [Chryseobacterium sp. JUb7]MCS3532238.1 hypothetical protein [Chryseobacterium sp. JUb7]